MKKEELTPSQVWYRRNRERVLAESHQRYHSDPARQAAAAARAARARAIIKLRLGTAPLTAEELGAVLPGRRAEARVVKPRTLQAVGTLVGLTREWVRRILKRGLADDAAGSEA